MLKQLASVRSRPLLWIRWLISSLVSRHSGILPINEKGAFGEHTRRKSKAVKSRMRMDDCREWAELLFQTGITTTPTAFLR